MPALWHWKHLASSVSLPGASGNPGAFGLSCAHAGRDRSNAPSRANRTLDERHKVVFTDALQHEKGRRAVAAIGDEVRAAGLDRVRVAGAEPDLLLGIAQEEPQVSLQHVERVLDIVVIVPGHLLGLRELDLGNKKAGPRRVLGPALDFIEMAAVLYRFHGCAPFALNTLTQIDDKVREPLRIGEQRSARAVMGDAAAVEDHCVVGDAERYLGVLLDEDQRKGVFSDQSIEHFKERLNDERGESFERLVHQQQRGIAHQRAADGEHLLLAAGDLVALVGAPPREAREEVVYTIERPAAGTSGDAEIFLDAERREDLALLRHEADAQARALVDRQARNRFLGKENFPRGVSGMAHDGGEQGGLADAVAPQYSQRASLS